jgi:hypothetical protein
MRIALAMVCLADLIIRAGDLTAHYTANGIWPAHLIKNFGWYSGYWSLHSLYDSYTWEIIMFTIHIIFVVFLLIGYKTKISNLIVWLLYISLHNRNLFILQAGDDLLRLTLFWGLFLPWQHSYSIDSLKTKLKPQQNIIANLAYLLLIFSVYFFTVSLKTSPEWRTEGSAIYYALSLDQIRLPYTGDWLYTQPFLMKFLTYIVFIIEILIPLFILLPSKKIPFRFYTFLLILILHIGIGLTLFVGLFFIINIVTAIALIPDSVLNNISYFKKSYKTNFVLTSKQNVYINQLKTLVIVLFIFFNLLINLSAVQWFSYEVAKPLRGALNAIKISQYWGMFSPSVLKNDGWFVYDGRDSQGRQHDLRVDSIYVDFKKPKHVVSMYKTDRWRKLAENMQGNNTFLRPLYCNYILNKWNIEHPNKKIAALNLYFVNEINLANYQSSKPVKELYCYCTNEFFPNK